MNNVSGRTKEGELEKKTDEKRKERVVWEKIVIFGEQANQEVISSVSVYNLFQSVKNAVYHIFSINHTHKYKD